MGQAGRQQEEQRNKQSHHPRQTLKKHIINDAIYLVLVISGEEEPQAPHAVEDDSFVSMEPGKGGPTPQQLNKMMHQALTIVNHLLNNLEKDKGAAGGRGAVD